MGLFRYIAVILCVAESVRGDVFSLKIHRIESSRSRLIRTGKWAEYQDRKSVVQTTRLASNSQPLIDYNDGEYIANVSVGTPPQRFLVVLSLRSGVFWVPDKTCPSKKCPPRCRDADELDCYLPPIYCKSLCDPRCCNVKRMAEFGLSGAQQTEDCGWRNRFDSSKSSSYRKNGTQFLDMFSADVRAAGFIGFDTATLGDINGLKVSSQTFGQATSADYTSNDAFDGVLGLGSTTFGTGLVPLLQNAKAQKVIPSHVVTVALIREGVQSPDLPGGTITFGGVDGKNCDPKVSYVPAWQNDDPTILTMDGVSFGSYQATDVSWTASIMLTSTALTGPSDVMDDLARVAGAKKDEHNIDTYNIACNATVPSLFVSFSGHRLEIPPSELVRPRGATDSHCILNVRRGYPGAFFFGAALAREYCLTFDYDNAKFGFSRNRYNLG